MRTFRKLTIALLGIALIVVGTAAVVGSLTVADPTRIW